MDKTQHNTTTTVRIQLPQKLRDEILKKKNYNQVLGNDKPSDIDNPVYQEILENIYDAAFVVNKEGIIIDFNSRAVDFFQYNWKEINGLYIFQFINGSDKSLLKSVEDNIKNKRMTLIEDCQCLRANNSSFPAEITINKLTLNSKNHFLFLIRNISLRKKSEMELQNAYNELNKTNIALSAQEIELKKTCKELKDKEWELAFERDLLFVLMDNIPEYIFFKDKDLKFIRINQAYTAEMQLNLPQEAVNKTDYDFYSKDIADKFKKDEKMILETGVPLINQETKIIKDGEETWLTSTVVPIREENGNIEGLVGIRRNSTDLKIAEKRIIQEMHKAEKANDAKSDFLANISHELRSPLNPIIGFASIIKNSKELYSQDANLLGEHIDCIIESAQHLQIIIEDLLLLSKSTSSYESLELCEFSIQDLFRELINLNQYQATCKDIDLKFTIPKDTPDNFLTDRKKLYHILSNFIGNSLKFTDNSGSVELELLHDKSNIIIQVKDTGIGIDKKDLKIIFDRFIQAEEHLTKTYDGAGLGLAIVKEFSKIIKCEVFVKSTIGEGSTFGIIFDKQFILPKDQQNTEEYVHKKKSKVPNILIVDDSSSSRSLLETLFKKHAITCRTAINGEECLKEIKKDKPDLLILDLQMPKMNGIEVMRELRNSKEYKNLRVIVLTAYFNIDDNKLSEQYNILDWLIKPISKKTFDEVILKHL